MSLGWFESINFRESEKKIDEDGEVEVELLKANPDGLTDTWLTGKYRFLRGPQGHFALLLGVKFLPAVKVLRTMIKSNLRPWNNLEAGPLIMQLESPIQGGLRKNGCCIQASSILLKLRGRETMK